MDEASGRKLLYTSRKAVSTEPMPATLGRALETKRVSDVRSCTCQKAKAWLEERGISYDLRDIKQNNPTVEELTAWYRKSGLPLKKFFNTSGLQYKALGLKDKLTAMSEDEQLALLATDGMLVKRPLLVGEDFVLTGFRAAEWEARLG